eukprot:CAMPEP_0171481452 /NCGR_PEP_ID=MMETSP0946-20130122/6753_1 /TAXON_ID=109269 /ORGANISM="Vaucheria litorea, Strain CCMP2940" /LENGTH=178 /DNA_ID=CAMNT_0012013025 /DNA_START=24 /DNA_END=557 /DNA_ORIENTATION=-
MSTLNEAWEIFKQGVRSVLQQWTTVQLAVENNWGGGDSRKKLEQLESKLVEMFRVKKNLYREDIEDFLTAYLDDHFGTYAEDGSPSDVSRILTEIFEQCGRLEFNTVAEIIKKGEEKKCSRVESLRGREAFGDDDDSSDSHDEVSYSIAKVSGRDFSAVSDDEMEESCSKGESFSVPK